MPVRHRCPEETDAPARAALAPNLANPPERNPHS